MSRVHTIDGVDVTSRVEFGTMTEITTAARGGERGGGKVIVTDPLGTLNLRGWHSYTLDETLCIARPRMFTGRIAGKEIKRGPEGPIGPGRVWECELEDVNALAHMRPGWGESAKRPKEFGLVRVAWLLATLAVGGAFVDTGYVHDAFDREFDPADYRGNYPDEVLDDITGVRGRDWFIFWDYDALAVALFYNYRDAAVLASSLKISNVTGDADYDTVFPTGAAADGDDAVISRQHDEVYDGVLMRTAAGDFVRWRDGTTTTFFHDAPGHRVAVVENSRIGLQATAESMGDDYLAAHSVERDTLTIPVRLPASHVNLVAAGERVQVKLEHEPGYESAYVWIRVATKTVSEAGLGEDNEPQYDVVLKCTDSAPSNASGAGAPPPGVFPHPPPGAPSYIQEKGHAGDQIVFDHAPTDGHLLTWEVTTRGADIVSSVPTGWTLLSFCTNDADLFVRRGGAVFYKIASGDGATISGFAGVIGLNMHAWEWGDGVTLDTAAGTYGSISDQTNLSVNNGGPVTPTELSTVVGFGVQNSSDVTSLVFTPAAGVTEIYDQPTPGPVSPECWVGIKTSQTGPTTVGGTMTNVVGWGGITYAVHVEGASQPPIPGQPVIGEVVTMSGASGTTAHPFADGSLHVFVDHLDQTAAVIYQDGECGDFTLAFTPKAGELVTVEYQGR